MADTGWVKVSLLDYEGYVSLEFVTLSTDYVTAESKEEEEARLAKEEAERKAAAAAAAASSKKIIRWILLHRWIIFLCIPQVVPADQQL